MGTMMNGEEHLYLDCHDWICVFKKMVPSGFVFILLFVFPFQWSLQ